MEEYKYKKYLKPKKGYLDEKQIDISRYDGIEDHTFDQWFDLKEGISLDDAVLALVEEMDGFDRTCKSFAICVSEKAINGLGEKKEPLLRLCGEKKITILREEDDVYYNYHDDREYRVRADVGYFGSADDAEEYLYIWLQKVPTPEEAEKERIRQEKQNRKRRLERGNAVCREYCLNHIEQVQLLEKRLQEMIRDLEARIEALGHVEDTVFLTRRMKLRGKIRALEMNLERFADAREYLRSPEELEKLK